MPHYRGEFQPRHPVFPEGSAAACKEHDGPVNMDSPDIVYTAEDDKAIEDYHKLISEHTLAPTGRSFGTLLTNDFQSQAQGTRYVYPRV
jgi:hypothetical protein